MIHKRSAAAAAVICVSCVVVLISTPTVRASVSANLEMDQDPVSQGWTVLQGDGGGSHSVAGGILTINSPTFYELDAPPPVLNGLSNSQGWRIDARLRLVSGNSPLSLRFWVHDGTELNYIDVGPSGLRLYGGNNNPDYQFAYPIGNTFHTYRAEVIGKSVTMYVDDQLVFHVLRTAETGGTDVVFFGDGAFSTPTVSEWDYVRISSPLPEPGMALSATALIGLLLRRRPRCRAA